MLFGDRVRELSAARGFSQKELSKASGISKQNIGKIWNNKTSDPRLETVIRIAGALGVSIGVLIEGVEFSED